MTWDKESPKYIFFKKYFKEGISDYEIIPDEVDPTVVGIYMRHNCFCWDHMPYGVPTTFLRYDRENEVWYDNDRENENDLRLDFRDFNHNTCCALKGKPLFFADKVDLAHFFGDMYEIHVKHLKMMENCKCDAKRK